MRPAFRRIFGVLGLCGLWVYALPSAGAESPTAAFQEASALATSQSAIGKRIPDLSFRDGRGGTVRLSDYLGKPLVLNFIYTGCVQSCNVNTAWLVEVFDTAKEALGNDSFTALTIGFDTVHDSPGRMQDFASQRRADEIPGWHFLSGDADSVGQLTQVAGFTYFKSAKGFDHLDQVTLIDGNGVIQAQVYGELFAKPTLIDPLKALVFGTTTPYRSLDDLIKKVRLFCILYDPATERYKFNYALFIQLGVGALFIGAVLVFLGRDQLQQYRRRRLAKRLPAASEQPQARHNDAV
ncbi:MAG: SCO family protein [Rhodospirillales bacterium]|nr:SCO family protein [Rhodospirillales bacterium]